MNRIVIKFRDGTTKTFDHKPRPGGSWTLSLKYEPGFVIVVDEWEYTTAFPVELVAEVQTEPVRRF